MRVFSHEECPQLSDRWWEVRCGIPTASDFSKIITAKDGLPSKSQLPYAKQLAKDLQCQNPPYFSNGGRPVNVHIQRGRNLEEEAVAWYAMTQKVDVKRVGFVTTDDGRFGCSPDFFIYKNGVLVGGGEVKCPALTKHEAYVKKGILPLEYKSQCHGGLVVCELSYWAFIQYCPDSTVPTLCLKVEPDSFTEALRTQLEAFDRLYSDVKANMGVKEVEVTEAEKIKAWLDRLDEKPSMELLNSWLGLKSELSEITHKPAKAEIWNAIQAYVETQPGSWTFNSDTKQFVVKEVA